MLFSKKKKVAKSEDEGAAESTSESSVSAEELIKPMMIVMPPLGGSGSEPSPRCIGLIGDVTEDKAEIVLSGLISLKHKGTAIVRDEDSKDPEAVKEVCEPMDMIISTHGGSASDMFAIYDVMQMMQEDGMEICTVGVGKVMSAGVLLLAAGTKGKRSIGKHCRVMIHGVSSGAGGQVESIDNELEEIKLIEDQYITALAANSAMTKRYIKNRLKKRLNVYIGAEEAVELGIADIIL